MIQFNLLPDVKLEYIKTHRTKRLIMLMASMVTAVSLTVLILLFTIVHGFQKTHLSNLSADIDDYSTAIKHKDDNVDIEDILTVQSQLNSLPALHEQKPVASRLFDYVSQVTPVNVSIARLNINFEDQTATVTGAADSLGTINKFVDTLKFTEYKNADEENAHAFYEVVLASFGRDARGASYTINFKFAPPIFESASRAELVIPNIITTRHELDNPEKDLVVPLEDPETNGESNE